MSLQGMLGVFILLMISVVVGLLILTIEWIYASAKDSRKQVNVSRTTIGDKSVETLCHIGVLKANFFPHLYNITPSPLLKVGFPVSRI